ncbi:hypothetical protein BS78_K197900, partial [Paspalum vaginatum]
MVDVNLEILSWNMRGLNQVARRNAVVETISSTSCHLAFLQETKLHSIDQFLAASLSGNKLDRFSFKPAGGLHGTRGGILLLWDSNTLELSNFVLGDFHISATATLKESPSSFLLTVVYGPTRSGRRSAFLQEIKNLKPQ